MVEAGEQGPIGLRHGQHRQFPAPEPAPGQGRPRLAGTFAEEGVQFHFRPARVGVPHRRQRFHARRTVYIDAGHQLMNSRPQALAEVLLVESTNPPK